MPAHTRLSMFVLKISCQKVASTRAAVSGGAFAALVIAITPLNTTHGSKGVAPDPGKGLFDRRHPGRGFGYSTKPSLARDQSSPSCGLQYDSGVKSGDPAFVSQALQTLLGARLKDQEASRCWPRSDAPRRWWGRVKRKAAEDLRHGRTFGRDGTALAATLLPDRWR